MILRGWNVEFMTWQSFSDAVCSRNRWRWERLCLVNMVIGGADMDGDYMCAISPCIMIEQQTDYAQESSEVLWF